MKLGWLWRLHLEHGGQALADVHHAGVLAGALDDPGGLRRQLAQPDAGGFVGAVLRPHHAEQAEFGAGGQAAEDGERAVVLLRGEAEFGGELGGVFGGKERGACCLVGVGHARFLGGARCGGKRRVPVGGRIRTVAGIAGCAVCRRRWPAASGSSAGSPFGRARRPCSRARSMGERSLENTSSAKSGLGSTQDGAFSAERKPRRRARAMIRRPRRRVARRQAQQIQCSSARIAGGASGRARARSRRSQKPAWARRRKWRQMASALPKAIGKVCQALPEAAIQKMASMRLRASR